MKYAMAAIGTVFAMSLINMPTQAQARDYPYCIKHSDEAGPGDCRFVSYRQCMSSASGLNADCYQNPRLAFGQQYQSGPQPRWGQY